MTRKLQPTIDSDNHLGPRPMSYGTRVPNTKRASSYVRPSAGPEARPPIRPTSGSTSRKRSYSNDVDDFFEPLDDEPPARTSHPSAKRGATGGGHGRYPVKTARGTNLPSSVARRSSTAIRTGGPSLNIASDHERGELPAASAREKHGGTRSHLGGQRSSNSNLTRNPSGSSLGMFGASVPNELPDLPDFDDAEGEQSEERMKPTVPRQSSMEHRRGPLQHGRTRQVSPGRIVILDSSSPPPSGPLIFIEKPPKLEHHWADPASAIEILDSDDEAAIAVGDWKLPRGRSDAVNHEPIEIEDDSREAGSPPPSPPDVDEEVKLTPEELERRNTTNALRCVTSLSIHLLR